MRRHVPYRPGLMAELRRKDPLSIEATRAAIANQRSGQEIMARSASSNAEPNPAFLKVFRALWGGQAA